MYVFRKIVLTEQMSPHRFAIHKVGSLVWFQTFIQNYRISGNQKEGINSQLKDVHNDLCLHPFWVVCLLANHNVFYTMDFFYLFVVS